MPIEFEMTGPPNGPVLLLAHGAGAGMASSFMQAMADLLAARGTRVARFEFDYMAQRTTTGKRRPPPKAERLIEEFKTATAQLAGDLQTPVFIGGKSMGGRVASILAALQPELASGLVCLGYPFHPPNKPEQLRVAHLAAINLPTLIVQGERDPFGSRADVEGYDLSGTIALHWVGDGDHDFGPRGGSGFTKKANMARAADAVTAFMISRVSSP